MPKELRGYTHDPAWTKKGQRLADRMCEYIREALLIPNSRRLVNPRIVAYRARVLKNGKRKLPMMNTEAIYYPQNFIGVIIPPALERVIAEEYKYLQDSPVIGSLKGTQWNAFKMYVAHEVAHWVVDAVLRKPNSAAHGNMWRVAYALLRERFTNH